MNRTAIYVRVSTEDQAKEGFSIPAQRDRLTAYIHSQDWELYDYYIDDGYSAKDTKRPAFQRMVKDAEDRKIDIILVYKLDRFTRSVRDLYEVLEKLNKWNVSFRSSQEQFDTTTTMGRAMIGMLGIFAQWERETIADRVYLGMEEKAMSGERNGAMAPTGYDLVDGKLVPNQDASLVQRLFELYLENKGIPTITKILAGEGKPMHHQTIWYILQNPVYCGRYRWNYRSEGSKTNKAIIVKGDVTPLVSIEDFERVQSYFNRKKKRSKAQTSEYMFSGVARCARCGSHLTGAIRHNKSSNILFYRCTGRLYYGKCDLPRVREDALEFAFFDTLQLNQPELMKLITIKEQPKPKQDTKKLERELTLIKKRKEKWRQAYVNELITIEELRSYTDKEREREEFIQGEIEKEEATRETYLTPEEVFKLFKDLRKAWNRIKDTTAKKLFVQEVFEQITIDVDHVTLPKGTRDRYDCLITGWELK